MSHWLIVLTLSAASLSSPNAEAVDLAKFASCVAVMGSPIVGRAALELATSLDVGYKNFKWIRGLLSKGKLATIKC